MGLKCGIVGLPNVGKSTLFNALTSAGALAANYPFATKEPNIGMIVVPDERLDQLAALINPRNVLPTNVEIVDIAGLIKGASKGEGLGNQFLGNIREVDAILHVVRCFEDDNVVHVDGSVNPIEEDEVPFNPFTQGEVFDVNVPCPRGGFLSIAHGSTSIIILIKKSCSFLWNVEIP